jgi:hypothetical protein
MTYIEMFILLLTQPSAAVNLFAGMAQHERFKVIPALCDSKKGKQRAKQEMGFGSQVPRTSSVVLCERKRNAKGTQCELCKIQFNC